LKGSEFAAYWGPKGVAAWEAAAVDEARQGGLVPWPMVPLQLTMPGHTATILISADDLAIGTPDDFLRLPLRPVTAQTIANLGGMLLPTPKLVYEAFKQATVRLMPVQGDSMPRVLPNVANHDLGANMAMYVAHNAQIEAKRQGQTGLLSGTKKNVVTGELMKPGKVVIYGWFYPDLARPYKESMDPAVQHQPIQPRSNFHEIGYVDYSHGIRFVSGRMVVDGQDVDTASVMADPVLSALVSDRGPVRTPRYPAPGSPPVTYPPIVASQPGAAAYGAQAILDYERRLRNL